MAVTVVQISTESFTQEVLNSQLPVLVDCWAPWCMPCLIVGPTVEELANEYEGKVKFCKVNVDDNPDIAGRYGIMGIPTLLIFKDGELVDQIVGAAPKEQISAKLDNILQKEN
ncbi:MAG TPA: thioredoxin [bacterium (Candidatus Stahlbacteria)]|nr:thioredoxin [Candidatus Stahlbacteria bacterium]